jgi:hypothetical protein
MMINFSNIACNTLKNFSREKDTGDKYKIANTYIREFS